MCVCVFGSFFLPKSIIKWVPNDYVPNHPHKSFEKGADKMKESFAVCWIEFRWSPIWIDVTCKCSIAEDSSNHRFWLKANTTRKTTTTIIKTQIGIKSRAIAKMFNATIIPKCLYVFTSRVYNVKSKNEMQCKQNSI